ncbi:MAG: sigma 54-interacting transcriptional regulator [Syntrophaceae bacterium]|nr:sigma 54-interacting transcriptional regulator [Syntrophaceae bacterium]
MDQLLMKEVRDNLTKVLDSLTDIVAVYGPDTRVVMVNRALCDYLRIRPEDWVGKTTRQIISEGYYDKSVVEETIRTRSEVCDIIHGRNGLEALSRCRPIFDEQGELKFLVVTSTVLNELNELKLMLDSERRKADQYLREIEHLRKVLLIESDFVFESPQMKAMLEAVKRISPTECTVLISGESGVGKEVLAKIIHMNSPRRDAPFIPISIPAIPENLLESELFGYEEGAFTGSAKGGKVGLFEIARDGTLFLDEVGDIPYRIQVKILRAIETGEITRVGGIRPLHVNIRIISATNRDMESEVRRGSFREDLFYRLNVFPLKIKPLRERPEDIWPMARHFLARMNQKYKLNKDFTTDALEDLKRYSWPGNVRELRNLVERLTILSHADSITSEDVRTLLGSHAAEEKTASSAWEEYTSHERSLILSALKETKGNKSRAAKILNMPRSRLYRKLKG